MQLVQSALTQAQEFTLKSGFVSFHQGETKGQVVLRGLYVPSVDRYNRVRGRVVLIDRTAPKWFWEKARESIESKKPVKLKAQVNNIHAQTLAFARPMARNLAEALEDWELECLDQDAQPSTLDECQSRAEQYELIAKALARHYAMSMIRCRPEYRQAYAVSESGTLYQFQGIEDWIDKCKTSEINWLKGNHQVLNEIKPTRMFHPDTNHKQIHTTV